MKQNRRKKITTIALTDEQRAAIESASDRDHGRLTDGVLRLLAYWEQGHVTPEAAAEPAAAE